MIEYEKKALRGYMKERLAAMSKDDRRAKSEAILDRLTALASYKDAQTVLGYASFGSEVQTDVLLERILKDGKALALPRLSGFDNSLVLHRVTDLAADLSPNNFGIREPHANLPGVGLDTINLILVPGLAFDEQGNRLGRGLGCYDRLIARACPGNVFAALAFESQIVGAAEIPEEENDMPMDMIVTDLRAIDLRDVFDMLKRQENPNG